MTKTVFNDSALTSLLSVPLTTRRGRLKASRALYVMRSMRDPDVLARRREQNARAAKKARATRGEAIREIRRKHELANPGIYQAQRARRWQRLKDNPEKMAALRAKRAAWWALNKARVNAKRLAERVARTAS